MSDGQRIAKARDEWFASPEGVSALAGGAHGQYLRNRLEVAYIAGWTAKAAQINTPEVNDFLEGVRLEAAHQVERWGAPHDRSKSAEHWYWLIGYLAGKALRAAINGDKDKAKHHCISTAAALLNWHAAIIRDESGAGIGEDADLQPEECKR